VLHLVMDFRLDIVEARLKEIQQQLRQASSDMSRVMELMKQYKETQELRDLLARKLGSDLVVG
jgi:DNA primase